MKFICSPADLSEALAVVSKAIPTKVTIPLLEGIKILAEGDTITLSATDMEMYIEKKIKAQIKLEGETVVLGKFFAEFIKKLSDKDQIEIEKTDDKLMVRYGDNEGEIQCMNEDTYPTITQVDDDNYFVIKEGDFKKLLDGSLFCFAMDDSRPVLKGCLLEINKDNVLTSVTLDGYRLAICKSAVSEAKGDLRIIISGKTLLEISKILTENNDNIKVNIQKNNILIDLGHTRITTRLMEGDYLNYENIISKNITATVVVNKAELSGGLDRASLISRNKKTNFLRLSISDKQITIRSNGDVGSIRETISCTLEGKEIEVAFNSKYLFEALNHVTEDFIRIDISSSNSPVSINPLEGSAFKYIVLPVRMLG